MRQADAHAPAEKAAAGLLFGVSVLHLPAIYLLVERSEGAPSFWLLPLAVLAVGASWGSGLVIERRTRHPVPWLSAVLAAAELPLALALNAPWGALFLASVAGVSLLAVVSIPALLNARQSM